MLKRLTLALVLVASCLVSTPVQAQDSREQAWAEWTKLFNQAVFQGKPYREQTLAGFRVFADGTAQNFNPGLGSPSAALQILTNLTRNTTTRFTSIGGNAETWSDFKLTFGKRGAVNRNYTAGGSAQMRKVILTEDVELVDAQFPASMFALTFVDVCLMNFNGQPGNRIRPLATACLRTQVKPSTTIAELTSPTRFEQFKTLVAANLPLLAQLH